MSKTPAKFVLCVRNDDCPDLEVRKLYQGCPISVPNGTGFFASWTNPAKTTFTRNSILPPCDLSQGP